MLRPVKRPGTRTIAVIGLMCVLLVFFSSLFATTLTTTTTLGPFTTTRAVHSSQEEKQTASKIKLHNANLAENTITGENDRVRFLKTYDAAGIFGPTMSDVFNHKGKHESPDA